LSQANTRLFEVQALNDNLVYYQAMELPADFDAAKKRVPKDESESDIGAQHPNGA